MPTGINGVEYGVGFDFLPLRSPVQVVDALYISTEIFRSNLQKLQADEGWDDENTENKIILFLFSLYYE
jgi:hypothetical protein